MNKREEVVCDTLIYLKTSKLFLWSLHSESCFAHVYNRHHRWCSYQASERMLAFSSEYNRSHAASEWQTDVFGYIKVQISLMDSWIRKVWGAEGRRYAWRNRDRLLLSLPALILRTRFFYGKQKNTIIVLRAKAVFQAFKWLFFNWCCARYCISTDTVRARFTAHVCLVLFGEQYLHT